MAQNSEQLGIRLSPELSRLLDAACEATGTDRSGFARMAIAENIRATVSAICSKHGRADLAAAVDRATMSVNEVRPGAPVVPPRLVDGCAE